MVPNRCTADRRVPPKGRRPFPGNCLATKKEGKSLVDSYVEVGQNFWRALTSVATKFPHFLEGEIFFSSYVELYQVSTKRVQTVPQGADYKRSASR